MKPDWRDAPEWANWLVLQSDGRWIWFEQEPQCKTINEIINECQGLPTELMPVVGPHWFARGGRWEVAFDWMTSKEGRHA